MGRAPLRADGGWGGGGEGLSGLAWGVCRLGGERERGGAQQEEEKKGEPPGLPQPAPPPTCCCCSAAAAAARGGRGPGVSFPLLQERKDRARPRLLGLLRARGGGGRDLTRERAERSRSAGPVMRLFRRAQSRTRPKGLPAGRGGAGETKSLRSGGGVRSRGKGRKADAVTL